MEYKNQTENRAFQEMLQAAVKRLQNRSGEDLAAKSGAVFHSSRNVLEVLSFYETIEIQLPEFRINSNMDEWHYLTLLHYLDMADGTEGSQKLITFGNLKDGSTASAARRRCASAARAAMRRPCWLRRERCCLRSLCRC